MSIRNVEVLITWYGVNYAKKMLTDMKNIYKYSVLRFWLPFEPNTFMIPTHHSRTVSDDVDEGPVWPSEQTDKQFYESKKGLFDRWYQKHKQYVRMVKKKWEEKERELARAREAAEREAELVAEWV